MSVTGQALQARFVLPICGPPVEHGVVRFAGETIVGVGHAVEESPAEDLGSVVLMPGLVNAHTHLEFSDLHAPLGSAGELLPDWIREVIALRRGEEAGGPAAIATGLAQSLAAGVTTLGEIATYDWRAAAEIPAARPRVMMFHESIGPTAARAQAAVAAAETFLQATQALGAVLPGLSPHAPYTVHPRLLSALVELSQRHRVALAMHLAESREELELLNLGSGPFREMLEAVGAWDPADEARLSCTLDYLAELARAERAVVIHGNYLEEDEISFLAEHAARMAVVHCPRTHAYFEHEPYPLAALLAAGVPVALGTDSRASNPNLSLLEDARAAAEVHPDVPAGKLLELATLGGARALGLADRVGTIEAGKAADLVALEVDEATTLGDVEEAVIHGEHRVRAVWLAGRRVL